MNDPFLPGLLRRLPLPPRKAAVVRASRLGDLLCAYPAFRALRAALPDAELCLVTLPLLRELAGESGLFDRIIPFPGYPGIAEQFFRPGESLAFFQAMQGERFDLAVQLQGSGVYSNPFTLMLGARLTAGCIRPEDPPGHLAAALRYPEEGHEIDRALALPLFLGAPPQGRRLFFPLSAAARSHAEGLLAGHRPPFVGLHPGAREPSRRWPLPRFAALGAALARRLGATLVILGDLETRAAAQELRKGIGQPLLDLAGATSLPELGAVVERLALLVTNDSGPAHVAYALGTPTLTLCRSDERARYGPPPGPFRVLFPTVPGTPVTVEEALDAALGLCLGEGSR